MKSIKNMTYPPFLKKGDTISITAISCGFSDNISINSAKNAIINLHKLGYQTSVSKDVWEDDTIGASGDAQTRAREFMEEYNSNSNMILCACGGDFACEILPYIDFNKLTEKPKWIQGYSDITNINFTQTTINYIASLYADNFKSYGMKKMHSSLLDAISLANGEQIEQNSFEKYSCKKQLKITGLEGYRLTTKVKWNSASGNEERFSGRIIGGCLDVLMKLVGTRFDNVKEWVENFKDDGIIWFFDIFDSNYINCVLNLWQLKNAGWFNHVKGFIFGRPLFFERQYNKNCIDAIKRVLSDLNVPIIFDACIGHCSPQMCIVLGSMATIHYKENKGALIQKFN